MLHPPPLSRRQVLGNLALVGALTLAPSRLFAKASGKRKLGVALVGLGNYSTGQLGPALRLTKDCRLAGVVTGSLEKGRQWAKDFGFPETHIYDYQTMSRIADNTDIDIVYVVTPNALHAEHSIAAAKAGKHVICEKPMAVTVDECDTIIAACKEAGVSLNMGYRQHYEPYTVELKRLAKSREFGPFLKTEGDFSFIMNQPQWRAEKALAGGGPLMDIGIYVIQNQFMAAGEIMPVAVTASEKPKDRPDFFRDVEETIDWTMEFTDGGTAIGSTSYNRRRNFFHADAANGWYKLDPAFGYRGQNATSQLGPVDFKAPASQQALHMDCFARHIRDGTPNLLPGEIGRRDMVVIEAIYASASANGKRIELKF